MRTLQGSRVLVTGACGFLGSHLIPRLLKEGAEVIGVDFGKALENGTLGPVQSKITLSDVDIANHSGVKNLDHKVDLIVHLAAIAAPIQCEENPSKAFATNVLGTFNLLKLAKEKRVSKFLFSSTAHVYGISPKYMPTDEKHPLALQDTYTTTKILGESLCQLFYSNHSIEYIVSRLFNSYGPGQSTDYFIPAMIAKARTGSIELKGRYVTKDFVYVDDVIDAFAKALVSDYVGEINIGSGQQTTLEYVAQYVARAMDATISFSAVETGGPTHMQSDPTRASRILGWRATTSMENGLDLTIASSKGTK
jgi:nucleoside-diphosphate-sugar epimerase